MNIVEELSKKIKLTETEKEILEYMVENLDALLKLSSRKLAEKRIPHQRPLFVLLKNWGIKIIMILNIILFLN